ncbi:MAG: two pore domain potassium channel family protein [Micromonosporaceae bacterium]|nr:two pore domain potassium channel family protein [Micromonosporaceae bacterium]
MNGKARIALIRLTSSLPKIIALYIASLFLAATLFSLLEGKDLSDGLWWAVVTALTIGYGDIAPASSGGRAVSIVFQHFWIFGIAPLVIANILTHVIHDTNQFSHAEQEWQATSMRLIAQKLGVELPPEPADTEFGDITGSTGSTG